MNIEQANRIPMSEILGKVHGQPQRTRTTKLWYLSPLRAEKTASFQVDTQTNHWYDFGDGRGGDLVDFVQAYLKFNREADTVVDALRWIKNMGLGPFEFAPIQVRHPEEEEAGLVLKAKKPIQHLGLIHCLEKRGIPLRLAQQHLKEIHVRNPRTKKSFFALGIPNEEGGYELRNPFFKGSLGSKAISFIRGQEPKPETIHIFEGVFDYLSAVAQTKDKGFKGDTIVLNSLSCLKQIAPYIQNYGYRIAYSWLDNDKAGASATASLSEFCKSQGDLTHRAMNRIYAPHKDVNAWHMYRLGVTL